MLNINKWVGPTNFNVLLEIREPWGNPELGCEVTFKRKMLFVRGKKTQRHPVQTGTLHGIFLQEENKGGYGKDGGTVLAGFPLLR